MDSNLLPAVGMLSSAARMPLEFSNIFLMVANFSSRLGIFFVSNRE